MTVETFATLVIVGGIAFVSSALITALLVVRQTREMFHFIASVTRINRQLAEGMSHLTKTILNLHDDHVLLQQSLERVAARLNGVSHVGNTDSQ